MGIRALIITALSFAVSASSQTPLQKMVINYPTRTAQVWPLYIAKDAGYYQKYGFDVNLLFRVHPARIAMLVSGEAVMTAYTSNRP
jgi:ABC-type nitrate/sulfonate/bicarbonate transport system substrate-binding protein